MQRLRLQLVDYFLAIFSFYLQPGNLLSAVQIADSSLQEGQGMHGSLGRDNTYNNMAAMGPTSRPISWIVRR